jgi:putative MATE family efflux protein
MTKKGSANDFTTGSIPGKLIRFMIPILGSLILQAMYGAVDLLVVGRFGSTQGISGVSTGSSVMNLVTFVITGIATGVTVLIGRYLGEHREDRIGPLIGGAIWFFTVISILLAVLLIGIPGQLAALMQAPAEAVDLTVSYIRICGMGIFFIVAYNVIAAIFRGIGDSRSPLIFVAVACAVNIFGDLFFVAVLHMNAAGAAIATVMAQAVSVAVSLVIMKRKKLPFTLKRGDISPNREMAAFLSIGLPLGLQELMTQFSFLALCAFVNRLGLEASSGYGVASKLISFIMLVPSSLTQSMSSFIAQNVGAGREDRARKAMVTGMVTGASLGVVIFLLTWFHGDLVSRIFTSDESVVAASWAYLRGFGPESIVTNILFSFIGYFNGHSRSLWVMLQGMMQTFLVRLPLAWFMSIQPDASLTRIGLAAPAATVFGILINLIYYRIYTGKHPARN